jgi:mannose-6-phosphate isomerase-like protein (cupin superfamily)
VSINLDAKFRELRELWRPHVIAELNGQEVKVARIRGEFVWHSHDVDELFWVVRGRLRIELREGAVELGPNELYVVPRGTEHRPVAEEEVELVLFEPAGVVNTGDAPPSGLTAPAGLRLKRATHACSPAAQVETMGTR